MDAGLIWDWLGREGGHVLSWWLLVTLAGAAAWPLLWRVLDGLPDRGYTLARAAGLMLTGFITWFLGSVGLLQNAPGGTVFAWLVVIALSAAVWWRADQRPALRAWWREHRALVLVTELLFAGLLFGWAIFRAHNPEMATTEKPMEVMFINAIRASEHFPPRDAWLSGYAISYYYFGYVIIALLADLAALPTGIAFTLAIALLAALTGIGALGVVYNLVRLRDRRAESPPVRQALAAGLLAAVFVVFMGNLGTALIEFPYQGYTPGVVNAAYFDFWDVEGRAGTETVMQGDGSTVVRPVDADADGVPNWEDDPLPLRNWSFTWGLGWRYSRVVQDRDLNDRPISIQPITEFPNFSFLLGDVHPHVLALPFALLAIGLALNLVARGSGLQRWEVPLLAIWVGGMVFLNSWDAIYLPLLIGAEALRRLRQGGGVLSGRDLLGVARFAAIVGALVLVLYAPWILSFSSQASGVLPNVVFPTGWQQYFLQFGAFVVILSVFLGVEWARAGRRFHLMNALLALKLVLVFFLLAAIVLGLAAWDAPQVFGQVFSGANRSAQDLGDVLPDILRKRAAGVPSELLLLAFVALVVGRLFARPGGAAEATPRSSDPGYSAATGFVLLLVGAGAVLTLAPDFLYLHDNFAQRINTVFKLYYQGWVLFSLASAYAAWSVLAGGSRQGRLAQVGRAAFGAAIALLLAAGLLYPILAGQARALVDTGRLRTAERIADCQANPAEYNGVCPEQVPLTLDGAPTMVAIDEYRAIECLGALETGGDAIIAEAPGGAYEPHNSRFSALTGIPTLIGWQNHERQWRGPTYPYVTDFRWENGQRRDRVADVQELYTTLEWPRAWAVIDRYGIDYVVVGTSERLMIESLAGDDAGRYAEYQRGLEKFAEVLTPVCQSGGTAVYRVAPQ